MFPCASLSYDSSHHFHIDEDTLRLLTRDVFFTHIEPFFESLHQLSESCFLPGRMLLQLAARVIEPSPGSNKENYLDHIAMRVSVLVTVLPLCGFMLLATPPAFGLRAMEHSSRPPMSMLYTPSCHFKEPSELILTQEKPLKVRTFNIAMTPDSMNTLCDLRPPLERVEEIIQAILDDPDPPDFINFQEAFHEEAVSKLCEGIRCVYPFIIHSVLPNYISGFNSGVLIASKYRPKDVRFERFDHMFGIENLVPRGIIRVAIESANKTIFLYGIHTQSLPGVDRAKARCLQLKQTCRFMKADLEQYPDILQVLMGDFNTSTISEWGANNNDQPEQKVLKYLNTQFKDLFLNDHSPLTGAREKGESCFLKIDNQRISNLTLKEPRGSWYDGPLAHKGLILTAMAMFDRWYNNLAVPLQLISNEITWGTPKWFSDQTANTARMDYICIPRCFEGIIDGRVEIRRLYAPNQAESAISDHLPVDGHLWLNKGL